MSLNLVHIHKTGPNPSDWQITDCAGQPIYVGAFSVQAAAGKPDQISLELCGLGESYFSGEAKTEVSKGFAATMAAFHDMELAPIGCTAGRANLERLLHDARAFNAELMEKARENNQRAQERVNFAEARARESRTQADNIERQCERVREQLNAALLDLRAAKADKEQTLNIVADTSMLQATIAELRADINTAVKVSADYRNQRNTQAQMHLEAKQRADAAEAKLAQQSGAGDTVELLRERNALVAQLAETRAKLLKAQTDLHLTKEVVQGLYHDRTTANIKVEELTLAAAKCGETAQAQAHTLAQTREARDEALAAHAQAQRQLAQAKAESAEWSQTVDALRDEVKAFREETTLIVARNCRHAAAIAEGLRLPRDTRSNGRIMVISQENKNLHGYRFDTILLCSAGELSPSQAAARAEWVQSHLRTRVKPGGKLVMV